MIELIDFINEKHLGVVYLNKSFKQLTTLKIGGKIKLLFYPNSVESFILFYRYYLKTRKINNFDLIIIGNGSNILANSKDYSGIVVCFKKIKFKYFLFKNTVVVSSGVMMMDTINFCKKRNLGGLEKLAYIPGTIGGMVKMNASAYNKEISDNIIWVKVIDENGNVKKIYKDEMTFEYRKSSINDIILECCFKLDYVDENNIDEVIKNIKSNRILKQPIDSYNAGSTFKNIGNIHVWKLIDELGLRGLRINDAQVSNKHCNFLININNCHSDDMCNLIEIIQNKIYNKYNIKVYCEWIFINF